MSRVETAVILAAGRGVRLGALGREMPKGFLTIGEKSIIEESIDRLVGVGISRIVVVTGHLAHFYEGLESRLAGLVETIHNRKYAESGSLFSLSLALDRVHAPFLLLESDLIYAQRALTEVIEHPGDSVVLISSKTGSGDEIWVYTDQQGSLLGMSKSRPALESVPAGELVGITKIGPKLCAELKHAREELLARKPAAEYEVDGIVDAAQLVHVKCHCMTGQFWAEIDDEIQLEKARLLVYPNLRRDS